MSDQSKPPVELPQPDDVCLVCGTMREEHGDKHHLFNITDDTLIPLKPGPEPRNKPPRERGESLKADPAPDHVAESFATLMEILVEKDILDTKDILRVFRGRG